MLNNGNDNGNDTQTQDFDAASEITRPGRHVQLTDDFYANQMEELKERIAQLERQALSIKARGTGDVTEQAARAKEAAVKEEPAKTLAEQIQSLLQGRPMSADEIARVLHVQIGKVLHEIKVAKASKKIYNIGQPDHPRWFWRVGPHATSKDVKDAVAKLISDMPMSFAQICVATGIKGSLVQGALIELRRTKDVKNLGTKTKGRYFMLPETALDGKLAPKSPKAKE